MRAALLQAGWACAAAARGSSAPRQPGMLMLTRLTWVTRVTRLQTVNRYHTDHAELPYFTALEESYRTLTVGRNPLEGPL